MRLIPSNQRRIILSLGVVVACAACGDNVGVSPPTTTPDQLEFTTGLLHSLDSTGQVIVAANPGNAELRSLVDSTLLVLTAGVTAKRLDVTTNLTTAPLFFVGVHRVVARSTGGSFSTWNVVGMDSPTNLTSLVEISGFAQSPSSTAPSSVSGTIGDGSGIVNSFFLQVAAGGAVTEWRSATGTVSLSSSDAGAVCPGFTPTAKVTCNLETMHVAFNANASNATAGARQASATADVPAIRLTYAP